jgi:hypothetical protein
MRKTESRTCFGTGAIGIGAVVRHPSLRTRAGTLTGRTVPAPRTATVMAATNVRSDWWEVLLSDDAQQLSACACVKTRADPEPCEAPLCIGHWLPSPQQAMRASGVGNHPAQIAVFPAINARVSPRAARRSANFSTCLGCSTTEALSTDAGYPDGCRQAGGSHPQAHGQPTTLHGRFSSSTASDPP